MSYLQINQNSNKKEFEEKGSIDVTPYLDESDGGTGYSPPLLHNNQLLIAILVTVIVLLLIFAKLGIFGQNLNSSNDEMPISEPTPKLKPTNKNKSSQEMILEKNQKKQSLFFAFIKLSWKFPFIKIKAAQNQSFQKEPELKQVKKRESDEE